MDFGNELEHFSLRWNDFNDNMKSGLHDLLRTEDFVDVTIAAEGKLIQAHKMVLSVCSPYFKNIFKTNPCQHPIVFLKDVTHKELSGILQFMYLGEVSIQQEELGRFLKTAEALQIKGLTNDENDSKEENGIESPQETHKHPVKNKKHFTSDIDQEVSVKRIKPSPNNDLVKGNSQTSQVQIRLDTPLNNHHSSNIILKTEPNEIELSDGENDRVLLKDDCVSGSESFLQLPDNLSEIKEEEVDDSYGSGHPQELSLGTQDLPGEPYTMGDGNQEIRFVMSPRMRPCLVFNNYLYIKDHIGVALPGQPKTIYWRCKDISCKARCIQTDFKFRLKRNTYHQHRPNVDPAYFPIHLKKAYDVIKYLS